MQKFSQALFDRICGEIADGKSVREICAQKGMPDRRTFMGWARRSAELTAMYDEARLQGEEAIFDDIQHIADTEPDPRRAKVRIEAREWTLARRNRNRFGAHVQQEHSGRDGAPITFQLTQHDADV